MTTYGLKLTTRIGLFLIAYTPMFLCLSIWQFCEYSNYLSWTSWSADYITHTYLHYFGLATILLFLAVIGSLNTYFYLKKLSYKKEYFPNKVTILQIKNLSMVDPSILIVIFGFYCEIFNNTKSKLPSVLFLALVLILIFYYWPLLKEAKKDVQIDAEVKSNRKHIPWIIRIWQKKPDKKHEKKSEFEQKMDSWGFVYLISYAVFTLLFESSLNEKYMFMYVIGMLGLMLVYCHSKMLLINPILFSKYNLFEVKYTDGRAGTESIRLLITTKASLKEKDIINIEDISSEIAYIPSDSGFDNRHDSDCTHK
ncbi:MULTISPECIES: hypothetical protein [Snodgrassella]|uniref:hypothetical protein n=2 Tax=Neisseriaceae TaxID=481 RepID=UPI000816099A|nr:MULTISPECIES: hypothetical protein [Snodgrassella]SCB87621.1 hypothetical protein GA0061082_1031 [Snodgrassella sp. R-53583]